MPDGIPTSQSESRHQAAVSAVESWVAGLAGLARPLASWELHVYSPRRPARGWRMEIAFGDRTRRIDLLLTTDFPRVLPKVALVDRPEFLTWPHVEEDGILCLLPDHASVDFTRPEDVTRHALTLACDLVEDLAAGRREEDFRFEFNSYWGRISAPGADNLRSLLTLGPPSRYVAVWRGRRYHLLGESEEAIAAWLGHRFQGDAADTSTERGMLLWLDRALLPREYPRRASDVRRLARACGGGGLLDNLVAEGAERIVVAMAAPTANGPCLAGVTMNPPARAWSTAFLTHGFRPGKMPRKLLVSRFLGGAPVLRSTVERMDAPWVHGRGQDARFARLHASKVIVLGCGSVGAPVALQLAAAGVGRLCLIDHDKLKWANVGRHPLGASEIGRYKSVALAERIQSSYPHALGVDGLTYRWQDCGAETLGRMAEADLVVSAMGDWAAEGALNEWHLVNRKGAVVYGWTEAHACAGHAVAIQPGSGCFQCGFTNDGLPLLRVTDWPHGETVRQEPACGAVYQPYGPVELGHVVSLIAELVLDCLLGNVTKPTHRIWAARRSLLESVGGGWTPEWAEIASGRTIGGFVEERDWPRFSSCVECAAGAA